MIGQGIPCGRNSSYSFIPILSKLHWCFGHGLKNACGLGLLVDFLLLFRKLNLAIFPAFSITKLMDRGRNLSYSFLPILSKAPLVFWSCSEDMHEIWVYSSDYFCYFFPS